MLPSRTGSRGGLTVPLIGALWAAFHLFDPSISTGARVMLAVSLLIALGFEFVNGFHDTANAVATVIYTKSLGPRKAVAWSGFCNFLGVYFGGTAVAFGIVSLLPVELLVSIDSARGMAMVLALLIAAIVWNLGTWLLGLPASSSHTLIGAIIGVGLAESALPGHHFGAGVNWTKAAEVGLSLLISPLHRLPWPPPHSAPHAQAVGHGPLALRASRRRPAASPLDPRDLVDDLYRGQPGSRFQRRPEGDRPGHADPDRDLTRALFA